MESQTVSQTPVPGVQSAAQRRSAGLSLLHRLIAWRSAKLNFLMSYDDDGGTLLPATRSQR